MSHSTRNEQPDPAGRIVDLASTVLSDNDQFINVSIFDTAVEDSDSDHDIDLHPRFRDEIVDLVMTAHDTGAITGDHVQITKNNLVESVETGDISDTTLHVFEDQTTDYNPWHLALSPRDIGDPAFIAVDSSDSKENMRVIFHFADRKTPAITTPPKKLTRYIDANPDHSKFMDDDATRVTLESITHELPDGKFLMTLSAISQTETGETLNTLLRSMTISNHSA